MILFIPYHFVSLHFFLLLLDFFASGISVLFVSLLLRSFFFFFTVIFFSIICTDTRDTIGKCESNGKSPCDFRERERWLFSILLHSSIPLNRWECKCDSESMNKIAKFTNNSKQNVYNFETFEGEAASSVPKNFYKMRWNSGIVSDFAIV